MFLRDRLRDLLVLLLSLAVAYGLARAGWACVEWAWSVPLVHAVVTGAAGFAALFGGALLFICGVMVGAFAIREAVLQGVK